MLLMLAFIMNASFRISTESAERIHRQQVFNKLVSVSDYSVKSGLAKTDGGVRYPNWIELSRLTHAYTENLRLGSGLSRLYISTDEPDNQYAMCLYRLAVTGDDMRHVRLFVCGD